MEGALLRYCLDFPNTCRPCLRRSGLKTHQRAPALGLAGPFHLSLPSVPSTCPFDLASKRIRGWPAVHVVQSARESLEPSQDDVGGEDFVARGGCRDGIRQRAARRILHDYTEHAFGVEGTDVRNHVRVLEGRKDPDLPRGAET